MTSKLPPSLPPADLRTDRALASPARQGSDASRGAFLWECVRCGKQSPSTSTACDHCAHGQAASLSMPPADLRTICASASPTRQGSVVITLACDACGSSHVAQGDMLCGSCKSRRSIANWRGLTRADGGRCATPDCDRLAVGSSDHCAQCSAAALGMGHDDDGYYF